MPSNEAPALEYYRTWLKQQHVGKLCRIGLHDFKTMNKGDMDGWSYYNYCTKCPKREHGGAAHHPNIGGLLMLLSIIGLTGGIILAVAMGGIFGLLIFVASIVTTFLTFDKGIDMVGYL